MSAITLVTLFPSCPNILQQQWLEECVASVKGTSFKHLIVSCSGEEDWYYSRVRTYTSGGFVGCLDYDDYLNPQEAEEMYKIVVDHKCQLAFSYESLLRDSELIPHAKRTVTPRDVTQNQRVIHHLTILNSSLIPKNVINTVENLGIQKNIDWISKAYVALKFGALQFTKSTYVWRQHDSNATKAWKRDYEDIHRKTMEFLKCLAPVNQNVLQAYPTVEV